MNYSIKTVASFDREVKFLAKKFRSLKADLTNLILELRENPTLGVPLGNNIYKIRMAISSKGKGKSGGARVITYVKIVDETVYLLSIFDKSDFENISDSDISEILKSEGLF